MTRISVHVGEDREVDRARTLGLVQSHEVRARDAPLPACGQREGGPHQEWVCHEVGSGLHGNDDTCQQLRGRTGHRGWSSDAGGLGQDVDDDQGEDDHRGCRDDNPDLGVHERQPPRRPPRTALWGRGDLVENGIQDAIRERVHALLQPRPNDAGDLTIGAHCATSRKAGRASASRAARSPRIA